MRHAVTADLQFDTQIRYSTLRPDGITSRLHDSIECFRWIVRAAEAARCESLFVIGDIFDSRTQIDVSVIDLVCRAFADATEALSIYCIVGNHDSYLRTPRLNSLQMLSGSAHIIEEPTLIADTFQCLPWSDDPSDVRDMLRRNTRGRYLLTHATLKGSIPAVADRGLPLAWFDRSPPWEAVLLGDIHDPMVLRDDPLIRYTGAPLQIHFGDAGKPRGFVILDDEDSSVSFVENDVSPRFHVLRSWEEELPEIGTADFVRVSSSDPEIAQELASAAQECTANVEVPSIVDDDHEEPRLAVSTTQASRDTIRDYVTHMLGSPVEALIDDGVRIFEEASGSL